MLIVAVRTSGKDDDKSGISLFLVDASTKGVTCNKTHMVDNRNASEITFKKEPRGYLYHIVNKNNE